MNSDVTNYLGWTLPKNDEFIKKHLQVFPKNNNQDKIVSFVNNLNFKKDLVIDIGANIGTKALQFANIFKEVICFEPVKINFYCLTENCKSYQNIKLYNIGLSNANKKSSIQLSSEFINHYGAFSIDKFTDRNNNIHSEEISLHCLDEYDLFPNLIKIDTEGHEPYVLLGALETIKKAKPILILEHSAKNVNPISDIIEPIGYRIIYSKQKDHVWIYD